MRIYTGKTLSFHYKTLHTVQSDHPKFREMVKLTDAGRWEEAAGLVSQREAVAKAVENTGVELRGNSLYYKGEAVPGLLGERVTAMFREGLSVTPLIAFLDNLKDNPSYRAVTELFGFLESSKLPITDDGHFLAYKSVREDYTDVHSGKFDNSVGKVVKMPRNKVNENKDETCSTGLHFAAYEYAKGFGSRSGRMMVLKINPRDVVSIPSDYNNQKGRCCEYEVIEEVKREDDKLTNIAVVATEKKPELKVGDLVKLSAQGKSRYRDQSCNPHRATGRIVENERTVVRTLPFLVKWETDRTNSYSYDDLELCKGTYVPQVDNYDDGSIWSHDTYKFLGDAKEFPVDRDMTYDLQSNKTGKFYSEFYFVAYVVDRDNLVFSDGDRYITVTNVDEWDIEYMIRD